MVKNFLGFKGKGNQKGGLLAGEESCIFGGDILDQEPSFLLDDTTGGGPPKIESRNSSRSKSEQSIFPSTNAGIGLIDEAQEPEEDDNEDEEFFRESTDKKKAKLRLGTNRSASQTSDQVEQKFAEIKITKSSVQEVTLHTVNGELVPLKKDGIAKKDTTPAKVEENLDAKGRKGRKNVILNIRKKLTHVESLEDCSDGDGTAGEQTDEHLESADKLDSENEGSSSSPSKNQSGLSGGLATVNAVSGKESNFGVEDRTVYQFDPRKAHELDIDKAAAKNAKRNETELEESESEALDEQQHGDNQKKDRGDRKKSERGHRDENKDRRRRSKHENDNVTWSRDGNEGGTPPIGKHSNSKRGSLSSSRHASSRHTTSQRGESSRTSSSRHESGRPRESSRHDSSGPRPNSSSARHDSGRRESSRPESSRRESSRPESTRHDSARRGGESSRKESSRHSESARREGGRSDPARIGGSSRHGTSSRRDCGNTGRGEGTRHGSPRHSSRNNNETAAGNEPAPRNDTSSRIYVHHDIPRHSLMGERRGNRGMSEKPVEDSHRSSGHGRFRQTAGRPDMASKKAVSSFNVTGNKKSLARPAMDTGRSASVYNLVTGSADKIKADALNKLTMGLSSHVRTIPMEDPEDNPKIPEVNQQQSETGQAAEEEVQPAEDVDNQVQEGGIEEQQQEYLQYDDNMPAEFEQYEGEVDDMQPQFHQYEEEVYYGSDYESERSEDPAGEPGELSESAADRTGYDDEDEESERLQRYNEMQMELDAALSRKQASQGEVDGLQSEIDRLQQHLEEVKLRKSMFVEEGNLEGSELAC